MAMISVSLGYFLLLCLPLLSGGHETKRPLRSVKAPAETIVHYDIVTPAVTYRSDQEAYPEQMDILIETEGSSFTLRLQRNDYVLSAGFTSKYYTPDGAVVEEGGHDSCFYQGQVKEHPIWTAAVSTCHGLRGSFGDLSNRDKFFHLEPLGEDGTLEQMHALYLDTELKKREGQCGTVSHNSGVKDIPPSLQSLLPGWTGLRLRRQVSGFYIVEWTIYNDNAQFLAFGSSIDSVIFRSLETANNVDNLFRVLRVRIALVAVVTWSGGDPITSSTDANSILDDFQSFLDSLEALTDSTMLITGKNLDGSTVGLASVATMCSGGRSSGLSLDGGRSTDFVAATAAHELGHIFSMVHDDEPICNCADGPSLCIMAAISGSIQPTMWSQCSIDELNNGFNSVFPLNRCLTNEPSMTVGDPVCGNGVREGEEVCDCGNAEECQDPCCNANTCQLVDGAQCFSGDCCDSSCQFVAYGTTCRSAVGECGISEYCSGQDSTCPQDLHQQNGQECNDSQLLCYEGQCPSHQQQCQFHFGSNSSVADEQCFIQLNVRGDRFGNCGHNTTDFIPCSPNDTICGQLQCLASFDDFINRFNLDILLQGASTCTSFTTPVGSDMMSPGLTQDGIKCGEDQFCLEQRCVAVNRPACPSGDGGNTCSGNGRCNNLNQCSCNVGFSGTTCSATGPGGMGGDPHFSVALHDGKMLCYSVQGRPNSAFNLISSDHFLINAQFVPDSKRKGLTWMGTVGVVFKRALKYKGSGVTHFLFDAQSHKVHIGRKISVAAGKIRKLTSDNGTLSVVRYPASALPSSSPAVRIHLKQEGLDFTVKFEKQHLNMLWHGAVKTGNFHGLIGQFFHQGIEVDEVRKLLFMPNKAPVPVQWKPIWRFMEKRSADKETVQHCWAAMNPGTQGKGLIDGQYLDYLVKNVLSSVFTFKPGTKN